MGWSGPFVLEMDWRRHSVLEMTWSIYYGNEAAHSFSERRGKIFSRI